MNRFLIGAVWLASVTGCAVGVEDEAQLLDREINAGVLVAPNGDLEESDPEVIAVSVYLVKDNRLVHVTRERASPNAPLAKTVITDAIAGPTPAEARSGIWSAIPPGPPSWARTSRPGSLRSICRLTSL